MNVKNRKCIRKLSLKSLYANRRRNLIAIFAIALTTLLFTSMFTIVLSLNASYETYQFRQVGGYAHGTFKDVSPEQAERIAAHPKVKAAGARKVIGITAEGVFAKVPAEISYMDANCTKWSYATPNMSTLIMNQAIAEGLAYQSEHERKGPRKQDGSCICTHMNAKGWFAK